jgi:putative transposase
MCLIYLSVKPGLAQSVPYYLYTINAIESVNMSLRKVTKSRGSFPNDESVMKLFYLALINISKKWTMPLRDWKPALNRFTIQF